MKLRSALLAATVLAAAPIAAKAQAISGLYIGAGAGVNFMQQETVKSAGFPQRGATPTSAIGTLPGHLNSDPGIATVLSVGYGLGNGLRLELEGSYRTNKLKSSGVIGAGGNEQKYGAMVNALYDFDPSLLGLGFLPVVPYVGVGAGYQWTQMQSGKFYTPNTLYHTNDGDGGFAYQAIAGVSFPIVSVPGLSLTAEYRFMGIAGDRSINYEFASARPGVSTRATVKFDDDYNHSILIGVRYAFNAAPPPPPVAVVTPPPAREAARTYLVFFDWDRADLTPRARQVVAEAAQATTRVQVTRIQVNGYTDTSGTPRYNMGLSIRRAQNVANELVRDGVPRGAISIQGYGETHLLVPTAVGVREPQNRRVEIILQ
jgi:outer membrane protein OmpA-like peptidoglycan-associated protein